MAVKRIDQLTVHPRSTAAPFDKTENLGEIYLPVRDGGLASDATRKIHALHLVPYPRTCVQDFGATPASAPAFAVDCTAAIQAAIDASGGGTVFIPRGYYNVTNLVIPQGCHLMGDGHGITGTVLIQPDGVGNDMIISDPANNGQNYQHWTVIENMRLQKTNGGGCTSTNTAGPPPTDTYGSGIYFPNFCGEGTKFKNMTVQGFPNHGIRVNGAIPCWFQDLHLFANGISQEAIDLGYATGTAQAGYGLYLGGGYSLVGSYVQGISGDSNANALIGVGGGNCWITGVKSECGAWQNYAIEVVGNSDSMYVMANHIVHTLNAVISPRPSAVVHIKSGGATVWLQGATKHEGAVDPDYLITDSVNSINVPRSGGGKAHHNISTCYSSWFGSEIFHIDDNQGCFMRIGLDPPLAGASISPNFALGHTNHGGTGTATNPMQAVTLGTATVGPASFTVGKWVYAQLDGKVGYLPWFGAT